MPLKKRAKLAKVETQSFIGGRIDFKQKEFNFTEKQQEILKCLLDEDTKMVFLSGCSGTSKSYLAIYAALHLLERDWTKDILYVRTIQESGSKNLALRVWEAFLVKLDQNLAPFRFHWKKSVKKFSATPQRKNFSRKESFKQFPLTIFAG